MFYLPHAPFWMRMLYPQAVKWQGEASNKTVYLSFDDGPIPEVTPFVLDQLYKYDAKASFFCIGDNVAKHADIFEQVIKTGHRVGNHTMNHLNGWKTDTETYIQNTIEAHSLIGSNLFRPPYGKITPAQTKAILGLKLGKKPPEIIMWSLITGDFDPQIDGDRCFQRVKKWTRPGGIIVFHDSQKAFPRLKTALPATLQWLKEEGYQTGLL